MAGDMGGSWQERLEDVGGRGACCDWAKGGFVWQVCLLVCLLIHDIAVWILQGASSIRVTHGLLAKTSHKHMRLFSLLLV